MSELPVPERLWCSYPDCPCDREHNGVCQFKTPAGCTRIVSDKSILYVCGTFRWPLRRKP